MNDKLVSVTVTKPFKVVRQWSNMFGENCYELEDGRVIFVSFEGDTIRIKDKA